MDGFGCKCYVWMYRAFIVGACLWFLFDPPAGTGFLGIVLGLPIVGFCAYLAASALFLALVVPLTLAEVVWDSIKGRC
jgi:hypothetical protein